jgi:opacity protein-like surface antigen
MRVCARTVATLAMAVLVTPLSLVSAETVATSSSKAATSHAAQDGVAQTLPPQHHRHPGRVHHHKTPKAELFLGYTRFGVGVNSSNGTAGNRMVGLNGGSAALAINFGRYIGLVADFGGYADNKLLLTGTGANEPLVVNSSGTAYSYLFGPRVSFRNESRFTPFAQVLGGGIHASAVTATNCAGSSCTPLPSQNAFALTAGGGLDIRLIEHLTLRAVQAEYMMTRFASVPDGSSSSQNDLRLSSGLVFTFGGSERMPVQLACNVQPESMFPGDPLAVTATATNLNPKHPASYHWSSNGGTVRGTDATAQITTAGLAPGTYVVSGNVVQGRHPYDQASCTASFTIRAPLPPTISCSANPETVAPGEPSNITALAVSPQSRPLTYSYSATGGNLTNSNATAALSTAGVEPGVITVTCNVVDDLGKSASATTIVTVTAPHVAVATPEVRNLCSLSFERDHKRPERVDNEAKACLDDIALQLQHDSAGHLVIVGGYSANEKALAASERALNARRYLEKEKGVDVRRIELRVGTASSTRTATDVFVPDGATYPADGTMVVDPTTQH